ncbi:hypothetical protein B0H13DRAFT_2299100 [Mycena leptocephala]|nr:hypothetical protein B0H13DRAFT_2299100 [Mycena leptocephala]
MSSLPGPRPFAGVVQALGRVKTVLALLFVPLVSRTYCLQSMQRPRDAYIYDYCAVGNLFPSLLISITCSAHRSFSIGLTIFAFGWWTRRKGCMQGYRILWAGISDRFTRTYDTISVTQFRLLVGLSRSQYSIQFRSVFARTLPCSLTTVPADIILWQQVIHSFPSLHFLSQCPLAAAMFRCRGHAVTSLYRSCAGRGR